MAKESFPAIPFPAPNVDSLVDCVMVMKQCIELLEGFAPTSLAPSRTYVQDTEPTGARTGDFWVIEGDAPRLFYFGGKKWVSLTDTPQTWNWARAADGPSNVNG